MECEVCTNDMDLWGEYDCNHKLCLHCSLKMIFLYKNTCCPLCKQQTFKLMIISKEKDRLNIENLSIKSEEEKKINKKNTSKEKDRLNIKDLLIKSTEEEKISKKIEKKIKIEKIDNFVLKYNNDEEIKTIKYMLSNTCKLCKNKFENLENLKRHYKEHSIILCDECLENKKSFWFEINLYKINNIKQHKLGLLNEDGFSGHVLCIHCNKYFFDAENARRHCNLKHEICNICSIIGDKFKFYKNFDDLEAHYKKAHYCCNDYRCQTFKCYVFSYKTELLSHFSNVHKQSVSISDIKETLGCKLPYMNPYSIESNIKNKVKVTTINPNSKIDSKESGDNKIEIKKSDNFPKFDSSVLPTYLNRNILSEEEDARRRRRIWIENKAKEKADEIEEIVNCFLKNTITTKEMFDQVTGLIADKKTLSLMEVLIFGKKQREVLNYLKIFRKEVMFPKFIPDLQVKHEKTKINIKGFKVLDLSKKNK